LSQIGPVVILSLMFSLLETKLILPAHLRHIKIQNSNGEQGGFFGAVKKVQNRFAKGLTNFAQTHYLATLKLAVRERYTTVACFIAVLILVISLLPSGILRFVFFPNVPSDFINVELQMPQGVSYRKTFDYALKIEDAAWKMAERYEREVGSETPIIKQLMVQSIKDDEVKIVIELIPSTYRDVTSVELARWMRDSLGALSGIRALSIDANAGPSRMPVDMELTSSKLEDLRDAASQIKVELAGITGVYDIRDTFNAGGPELDIRVTTEGEALGLGQVALARQVRQAFFGAEVQRVQRGRHEVRVYVRFPESLRESVETLQSMWITLPDGRKVPFGVVGEARERTGVSTIMRLDRRRVVNVQADVNKSIVEPGRVNEVMKTEILPDLLARYPGMSYRFAGEAEDQADTERVLVVAMIAVLVMIFSVLAIPLRSYGQPLIIMSVIPFGLVGAFIGHLILGKEINVLSVIGIVGLAGIVVNDSLVMVDYINHHLGEGMSRLESVLQAGVRRFRAIVLTSVTTFMGLLPIQLETSIQSEFVKPMAISIAFGVLFATLVTLLLVPVLFFVADDIKALSLRVKRYLFGSAEIGQQR
jgi:multidrug efflux pump subunit AcrB